MPRAPDRSSGPAVAAMSGLARRETARERTIRELHELIAALDRRLPQIRRAGETAIARASAELRAAALKRIEELEGDPNIDAKVARAPARGE